VSLLDDMRRRRVTPDQYSYNSAIAACVKARQTQQMAAVLARMREAGYSPDLVTYSNLIQVLVCNLLFFTRVKL
jgi:pentatricopeptide repeat protein